MQTLNDKPRILAHSHRIVKEGRDGSVTYIYKKSKLAAVRAYNKLSRTDDGSLKSYGWEAHDRYFDVPGLATYWTDVDTVIPPR